jgi:hypothetical protein
LADHPALLKHPGDPPAIPGIFRDVINALAADDLLAGVAFVPEEAFVDFEVAAVPEPADGDGARAGEEGLGEFFFGLVQVFGIS